MPGQTILVLGGTGKTGRRVVEQLHRRGVPVRVGARRAEPAFDWGDRSTWGAAVQGVGAAYLLDPAEFVPRSAGLLRDFCALAVGAGTRRLVYLSSRDLANAGDTRVLDSEQVVRDAGAEWTILRPAWFAQNFGEEAFFSAQVHTGVVTLSTGNGLEPFIDAEDIAEVAAVALTDDGHAGRVYELTGPRLLTFGEAVGTIARLGGHDVTFAAGTSGECLASLAAHGIPPEDAALLDQLFVWIGEGRNAMLADGVQRALGREPRDFEEYVRRTPAQAWRG